MTFLLALSFCGLLILFPLPPWKKILLSVATHDFYVHFPEERPPHRIKHRPSRRSKLGTNWLAISTATNHPDIDIFFGKSEMYLQESPPPPKKMLLSSDPTGINSPSNDSSND